jgi:hypothetical protein
MTKIKPADPLAVLFAPGTYAGARVSRPDTDTLLVEGVRGTELALRFRRRLSGWRASLDVTARLDGQEARVVANADFSETIGQLWSATGGHGLPAGRRRPRRRHHPGPRHHRRLTPKEEHACPPSLTVPVARGRAGRSSSPTASA